jgi:hypothetical protein
MEMPDHILLSKVRKQGVYFDYYSLEKMTSVTKPKYKLAINILPIGIYFFCILTTNESACDSLVSLTVSQSDWENKDPKYLNEPYSYIDIKKTEVLQKTELLAKIKDARNQFIFVAIMNDKKFEELRLLKSKLSKSKRYISERRRNIIDIAFTEANIADEVLAKLQIA